MKKEFKMIDLTHMLSNEIPSWDGDVNFSLSTDTDYKDCVAPDLFKTQNINASLGLGTHIDAPAHVSEGGRTIDKLNLNELVCDCVMIDVSRDAHEEYLVEPKVIEDFEKIHGKIGENTFVIFHTGWSKFWGEKEKYHNNHKFPSLSKETAMLLIKRKVAGIGIDTFSCDTGKNGFPVHHEILDADKYLVENIVGAKELPQTGAKIFILPMKIKDATEAPVRIIALVKNY